MPRAIRLSLRGPQPEAISMGEERLLRFARNDSEDNRKTLDDARRDRFPGKLQEKGWLK